MSRTTVTLLPISHRVILPGSKVRISIPGLSSSNIYSVVSGKKTQIFGMLTYKNTETKEMYKIGTLVGIMAGEPIAKRRAAISSSSILNNVFGLPISSYSSNEWHVFVVGVERFKLLSTSSDGDFLKATIEIVKDKNTACSEQIEKELRSKAVEYLRATTSSTYLLNERLASIEEEKDPGMVGFKMLHYLELSVTDKQALLENFDLENRTVIIIEHIKSLLSSEQVTKELDQKVRDSMTKEVRNSLLRKKLQVINKELYGNENDPVSQLQQKLDSLQMPEDSKLYVQSELNRLKSMPSHMPDYNVTRNYIETIVNLPWSTSTTDNYDIDAARSQLDKDHFGLEIPKKRIIEYLAVRGLRKDMKGSIICFHGPPGVGKTSLGKSIAEAMGRKFHRISLGGVRDEAEIRGHRRTYVGAIPGVFLHAMKKCGANNPVILLDEIDKVGKDTVRGDPASALLEVLDPAQNNTFTDHYLAIPFDLSKVLFICTANRIETIPAPLLDRMELINISGYTTFEKAEIAKTYLIPKQITENGIQDAHIEIPESTLNNIITKYTREAGVRQLERTIASICRYVAVELSRASKKGQELPKTLITDSLLEEILGVPIYQDDIKEKVNTHGISIGLAWTPFGGKVLYVESSKSQGTGRLKITGQLGDVMKESVLTGLSWIKAHFQSILPPPGKNATEGLDGFDIHVHFPSGAVPKDGPSAGITIATALVSLITESKVRNDTAMTGEISLLGNVLPVGGIKEKVIGAHRFGIRRVILPDRNRKDIKEIPDNVKNEIEFIFVRQIEEVLIQALEHPEVLSNILGHSSLSISSRL